jgi:hypothetical protein
LNNILECLIYRLISIAEDTYESESEEKEKKEEIVPKFCWKYSKKVKVITRKSTIVCRLKKN